MNRVIPIGMATTRMVIKATTADLNVVSISISMSILS
jgi:hypothetical protein